MFSPLQKYILSECFSRREKVDRKVFNSFYRSRAKAKEPLRVKIITKSLERLIDRSLLVGYGIRTTEKWFIKEVKMTRVGIKKWEEWQKERQKRLPLK